jgi:hypothetical protein
MRKILILIIALINVISASCQNNKKLLNYFPDKDNNTTVIDTRYLIDIFYGNKNVITDTILALKYFFDNKVENMHDIEEGYNADENTYVYTPYTKKVCPLYKVKIKDVYLLCYGIKNYVYLTIYDYITDKFESTFTSVDDSDDYGNWYTRSTIFQNNYIATIQFYDKAYYILSKIDYDNKKFVELKKIEIDKNLSENEIKADWFYTLGISSKGDLLEDNP